ncbi:MAG TPA: hypothetical protein VN455_05445 [Methanotrichaceae archaeon]|nr:hypothetical protein [Methanotrichaceae archaeon]
MSGNKNASGRGVTLRTPADLQRITARVISDIFRAGMQVEHSGKIFQLGSVWLKAFEVSKLEEIEKRLAELEQAGEKR